MHMSDRTLSKLGDNIRVLRRKQGLTQEDLAILCGLHRTYVGGIERGERNISFLNLVKIAHALKITVSRLTEGTDI